jgi:hypothetical protein
LICSLTSCRRANVAPQLGQGVGRQRHPLRRAQPRRALRCLRQTRLEIADAEARQGALHAIDEAGAFADQRFALAARPPGVFRLERRDRRHLAVIAFVPQPAKEGSFQQLDIQPIGLRPAVLAPDRHARGMDDISFDAARVQPAGQPEAVRARFVGNRDADNRAADPRRLIPPALQQAQQLILVRHQLLQRMALDPRHDRADQPTGLAHLDHGDQCAILVQSGERSAQVIRLRHGALRRWVLQRRLCLRFAARPIASRSVGKAGIYP